MQLVCSWYIQQNTCQRGLYHYCYFKFLLWNSFILWKPLPFFMPSCGVHQIHNFNIVIVSKFFIADIIFSSLKAYWSWLHYGSNYIYCPIFDNLMSTCKWILFNSGKKKMQEFLIFFTFKQIWLYINLFLDSVLGKGEKVSLAIFHLSTHLMLIFWNLPSSAWPKT